MRPKASKLAEEIPCVKISMQREKHFDFTRAMIYKLVCKEIPHSQHAWSGANTGGY